MRVRLTIDADVWPLTNNIKIKITLNYLFYRGKGNDTVQWNSLMTLWPVLQHLYHQAAKGTTVFFVQSPLSECADDIWRLCIRPYILHCVTLTTLKVKKTHNLTDQVSTYHAILHYSFRKTSSHIKMSLNLSSLLNRVNFPETFETLFLFPASSWRHISGLTAHLFRKYSSLVSLCLREYTSAFVCGWAWMFV